MLQLRHGRCLLEVRKHFWIVHQVLRIERKRSSRQLIERSLPLGQNLSCEHRLHARLCAGTGKRIQRSGNHQLQIALCENYIGVLPVQHLALLRDAQLAREAIQRLRKDCSMRGPTTASHRTPAAVEQAQRHAALSRYFMQSAMRLPYFPRAGNHAAIFIRV